MFACVWGGCLAEESPGRGATSRWQRIASFTRRPPMTIGGQDEKRGVEVCVCVRGGGLA